jgi:UDP-2,3-diacylglucosamine pyrophosphatase LpxH
MSERAYVVGDLHLGAGPSDKLEDFRDDKLFEELCGRIRSPDVTLILNGDVIDFVQIPPFEVPKPIHLLWPAPISVAKLEVALKAHSVFFDGLRSFVAGGGHIRYLVGNHDLDIVWPEVQQRLRDELRLPSEEQLVFEPGATRFHGVHVEHGHRWTPENCPKNPDDFIHSGPGDVRYLERIWGTDFMLQFFNELERTHPFADNVKPMLALVWHGLRKKWIGAREIVRLLAFLKARGIPWAGIASVTLAGRKELTAANAAAAFADSAWREAVLERARADKAFVAELGDALADLTQEEQGLAVRGEKVEAVEPQLASGEALGERGATLGVFREDREIRAARERLADPRVTHVVFGHTHGVVDGALDGRLLNYGTWLPSLNMKDANVKAKIARDGVTLDVLKDAGLYTVDRRLVQIDVDTNYAARVQLVREQDIRGSR